MGTPHHARRPPRALPALLVLLLVLGLVALLPAPVRGAAGGRPAGLGQPPGSGGAGSLYPVAGVVSDAYSGAPLAGVTVRSYGSTDEWYNATTNATGGFVLYAPAGTLYVTVDPPAGYEGLTTHVSVSNASGPVLALELVPIALLDRTAPVAPEAAFAGILAALVGVAGGAAAVFVRQQRSAGRSASLLSPFGWYVAGRLVLIPFQIVALLVVLYVFGTYLPALAHANLTGCLEASGGGCAPCDPSLLSCQVPFFGSGFLDFARSLLTGNWGIATIGSLRLPATDFLSWWLPYSIELAAFALLLSVAIGYPLGLAAGWREDGPLDLGVRGGSLVLLLLPTFLVVLFVLTVTFTPWSAYFGDAPYHLLPGPMWFGANGGAPSWIGLGGQTSPTGFPLLDGVIHGDWPFVFVVTAKNLLQALLIATIYVGIFFRYARQAVAGAARSQALRAARSRGVPESTLLWHHTGRRVLPVYLLTFGMTLPAYLGTQCVVEVLFNDQTGIGTILFSEMLSVAQTGIGFHHLGPVEYGNLYQVVILFLALVLLLGNLCADVLARYLDPTLGKEVRR